jgi:hypothetical protein
MFNDRLGMELNQERIDEARRRGERERLANIARSVSRTQPPLLIRMWKLIGFKRVSRPEILETGELAKVRG